MGKKTLVIKHNEEGIRLDKFLVQKFPDYSRAYFKKLIKDAKVLVNDQKTPAHYKLKEKDEITFELIKPAKISLEPDPKINLDIIFEDDDFLVINKPTGLVVHPSQSTPNKTLVNGILAYLPNIASVGEDSTRPGVVHRLDKEVSGLMVVTKNQASFLSLKKQFRNRLIDKKYLALVHGKINPPSGKIDFPIGRSKRKPYKMSIKQKGEGHPALTYYKTIKTFPAYSLLEISTKTGRTHQIRVHLTALGHPIVGDKVYKIKRMKVIKDLDRIFLHACLIQFFDLKGSKKIFQAELPKELEQRLSKLERRR